VQTSQLRQRALETGVGPTLRRLRAAVVPTARQNARDQTHLARLLPHILSDDSACIDVGACTGGTLRQIVRAAPNGRHIAFEPIPALAEQLAADFPRVHVRQSALSDVSGSSTFTHVVSRPAYSGLVARLPAGREETEEIAVAVERLDDVVSDDFEPKLIKIEAEGGEYRVLRGAQRLLAATRPYVVFEFGSGAAPHYGSTPDDVYGLFDDELGMKIHDLDGTGPYTLASFREVYYSGRRFNFVAHA
jgi:FkbM family methyltransferase